MTYFQLRKRELIGERKRKPHRDSKELRREREAALFERRVQSAAWSALNRLERVWR